MGRYVGECLRVINVEATEEHITPCSRDSDRYFLFMISGGLNVDSHILYVPLIRLLVGGGGVRVTSTSAAYNTLVLVANTISTES